MTSDPGPIRRGTDAMVYEQVAAILRDRIRSGEIAPRYPIPSKTAVKEEMGVSDSSWASAVRLLEKEGYVRRRPGLGVFVRPPGDWPDPP